MAPTSRKDGTMTTTPKNETIFLFHSKVEAATTGLIYGEVPDGKGGTVTIEYTSVSDRRIIPKQIHLQTHLLVWTGKKSDLVIKGVDPVYMAETNRLQECDAYLRTVSSYYKQPGESLLTHRILTPYALPQKPLPSSIKPPKL